MICRRVCDVVKGFSRNSDDVFGNCKVVHGLDREWKLLVRPAEHNLSKLTPFWPNGNFGTDSSGVFAVGILKRKVNIAVCFHFCVNDAAPHPGGTEIEPCQLAVFSGKLPAMTAEIDCRPEFVLSAKTNPPYDSAFIGLLPSKQAD